MPNSGKPIGEFIEKLLKNEDYKTYEQILSELK